MQHSFGDPGELLRRLDTHDYLADPGLATALFLALALERPLLLEGEPGVGKTELAKVMSVVLGRPLIRLQCYYGIDIKSAVYDWNYARQMLHIRLAESELSPSEMEDDIYSSDFLVKRPLLTAISSQPAPVLLIDEVDRTDEAFEALLLEFLGERQVSIPEIGTFAAKELPLVILTSNRTRDIHDALRRRCLYYWIDYPEPGRELAILMRRHPDLGQDFLRQVVAFVGELRRQPLVKRPGLAESLEWLNALSALTTRELSLSVVENTLGLLLKYYDDIDLMRRPSPAGLPLVGELLKGVQSGGG